EDAIRVNDEFSEDYLKYAAIEDINYIFDKTKELSEIGTKLQYANYLNTIFPNSTINNILYHGSVEYKWLKYVESEGTYIPVVNEFNTDYGVHFGTKIAAEARIKTVRSNAD